MNTSRDIITKLGGHQPVAAALGEDWKTIANWTRTGRRIPAAAWHRIAALPKAVELKITIEGLSQLPPNPTPRRAAA